jgi:8-oxo-dGTP pyrophosphatase MutT (NUDIX family)
MVAAAVVIPIVRHPEPAIVFVRRARHLRRNPGQMAFPGGKIDPEDADAQTAALREFEEELGIPRERVRIFDRMPDVVTLAITATVVPFLGVLDPPVTYTFDPAETENVHEIPLAALYAPGALHEGIERVTHEGRLYEVPSWLFDHDGLHVWGATARMLHELFERYNDPASLLSAAERVSSRY